MKKIILVIFHLTFIAKFHETQVGVKKKQIKYVLVKYFFNESSQKAGTPIPANQASSPVA